MATIRWDIYRIGDQNGPGLELIRPGVDVTVVNVRGTDWALANTGVRRHGCAHMSYATQLIDGGSYLLGRLFTPS